MSETPQDETVRVGARIESDLFNWMRRLFFGKRRTMYPKRYIVTVYVQHPDMPHAIHEQRLSIDAHSKQHARRRIAQEVTLRIGSARLSHLK
jgi:hypothetical protein